MTTDVHLTFRTSLEEEFHDAMLNLYQRAGRECGYWANYFIRDLKNYGGVETACRLLAKPEQTGLSKLEALGRLDITVEWLVLKPRYAPLFTEEERTIAYDRLAAKLARTRFAA
jgi:hypothetical protein